MRRTPQGAPACWPAKDRAGGVIPGAYLMTMDYGSSETVNYDFQDNVYLLENVEPASDAT